MCDFVDIIATNSELVSIRQEILFADKEPYDGVYWSSHIARSTLICWQSAKSFS